MYKGYVHGALTNHLLFADKVSLTHTQSAQSKSLFPKGQKDYHVITHLEPDTT